MADAPSSPATNPLSNPQSGNPNPQSNQPDPVPASSTPPPPPPPSQSSSLSSTPITVNPDSNPPLVSLPPPPSHPSISFAPQQVSGALPPVAPSFRPVPQFTPIPNPGVPNPNYQIPGVQPPGVSSGAPMAPGVPPPSSAPQNMMHYQMQPMRPYAPMPNGYAPMSTGAPQGALPGLPRYPSYHPMIRTPFPPRPPGATGLLQRAPVPGIPGVRPIIPPVVRPILPIVTPAEKPQTTVYVGKIAPTVDNEFMKYLLQLCGPVKSWKRAQDPTDGTPRRFGFCEFESAEGVLRALRLLTNLSIDGQDLVLNVNQATREYLERVVKKKTENSKKLKEAEAAEKGDGSALDVEKIVPSNPSVQDSKEEDGNSSNKENDPANFGIVTDEDKEADREAMEKLTSLIEERIKNKPLPPPPPTPAPGDGTRNSNSALPAKSRDGDSDVDITRNDAYEEKIDEEITSDNKTTSEQGSPQTSSHDRSRKQDRRSRDNERDMKREKEREIERYERETERERVRKEKEQRRKLEDAEHQYEKCLKDWEYREREKEKQRQYEKEREKERERKRRKEIIYEEDDEDEDSRKKWRRSVLEEKRKRRLREKEEDLADRQKEEEEIADAKGRAEEEKQLQQERDALRDSSGHVANGSEKAALAEEFGVQLKDKATEQDNGGDSGHENHIGDGTLQNGNSDDESTMTSVSASEPQQSGSAPAKKLGFGLLGSGKRTAVPSVFNEEDDDAHKDKKMRPLVPIDYSTEELQAVQPISGTAPSNLAAAAEFAKRISNASSKEEKPVTEKERSRRSNDRSSHRDRDQNGDDSNRTRDEHREKTIDRDTDRDHAMNKPRTKDNKKLLDAKQLIDMIPKTKEELFSYEINWAIYEHHALHERMRPWISKKITEFLGEEEYNKKSDEHEYERKTGDYEEGSGAGETKDRGLFDFLGKKEEEKPTPYQQGDQVNVAEFDEKVKISDHHDQHASSYNKVEGEEDKEKKHETLLQKLHRSESSSSSSSDEEEDEEKKKKRKEKKGLTDKIKEKISGDEHKEEGYHKEEDTAVPVEKVYEEEHHHPAPAPAPVVHYHEEPTDSPTEEKKGFLEKIKEKLPGHKKTEEVPVGAASHEQHSDDKHAAEPPVAASYEAGEEPKEKKGILEKIKEKLPGYHSKTEEDHKDIKEKEKDTPSY